jgi:predicted RNA binding protein YcfA (HicA-like mRNA interferase family)
MSGKLPQVGGKAMVKLLERLGYVLERQKGSHARMSLETPEGRHFVTVPLHRVLAKGTLHDILREVSAATHLPIEQLLEKL